MNKETPLALNTNFKINNYSNLVVGLNDVGTPILKFVIDKVNKPFFMSVNDWSLLKDHIVTYKLHLKTAKFFKGNNFEGSVDSRGKITISYCSDWFNQLTVTKPRTIQLTLADVKRIKEQIPRISEILNKLSQLAQHPTTQDSDTQTSESPIIDFRFPLVTPDNNAEENNHEPAGIKAERLGFYNEIE